MRTSGQAVTGPRLNSNPAPRSEQVLGAGRGQEVEADTPEPIGQVRGPSSVPEGAECSERLGPAPERAGVPPALWSVHPGHTSSQPGVGALGPCWALFCPPLHAQSHCSPASGWRSWLPQGCRAQGTHCCHCCSCSHSCYHRPHLPAAAGAMAVATPNGPPLPSLGI